MRFGLLIGLLCMVLYNFFVVSEEDLSKVLETKTNKILVTGCSGFIGFHTVNRLFDTGYEVVGVDNFYPNESLYLKRKRCDLLRQRGIQVFEMNISELDSPKFPYNASDFDSVINLAALAGVRNSTKKPLDYIDANIVAFVSLLEWIKASPKTKFIYASSSSVYGMNATIPYTETQNTDYPSSIYAATKKSGEVLAYAYHNLYRIPMLGLRFFTVYGPYGRPDMAYFSFAEKILKSDPITVYGEGKLKRDFTFIDDITEALERAVEATFSYEIVNLGNCNPREVTTLVKLLERKLNKNAIIRYGPKPPADVSITFANIEKAQNLLNFKPSHSLEDGMDHFVRWLLKSENK